MKASPPTRVAKKSSPGPAESAAKRRSSGYQRRQAGVRAYADYLTPSLWVPPKEARQARTGNAKTFGDRCGVAAEIYERVKHQRKRSREPRVALAHAETPAYDVHASGPGRLVGAGHAGHQRDRDSQAAERPGLILALQPTLRADRDEITGLVSQADGRGNLVAVLAAGAAGAVAMNFTFRQQLRIGEVEPFAQLGVRTAFC